MALGRACLFPPLSSGGALVKLSHSSVSTPRSSNRTCGFPASGSPRTRPHAASFRVQRHRQLLNIMRGVNRLPNPRVPPPRPASVLNWGPLPSAGVPGFRGTTSTSPPPQSARPVPHGRPVGHIVPALGARSFPCCVRFPCVRAAATTPVQRLGVVSLISPSRNSLPR